MNDDDLALDPDGDRWGDGKITIVAAAVCSTLAIDNCNMLIAGERYKLRREAATRIEDGRWP